MARDNGLPFLRIPPFPGHRAPPLASSGYSKADPALLAKALRQNRVGGAFWGAHISLPNGVGHVLAPETPAQLGEMLAALEGARAAILAAPALRIPPGHMAVPPDSDPWSLCAAAATVWAGAGHELALVGGLAGKPLRLFGAGRFTGCEIDPAAVAARDIARFSCRNPFSGEPWTALQAIAQLGEWRRLIGANRPIGAVFGVAGWKRVTLDAMLWDGTGPVRHARRLPVTAGAGPSLAAWKSRTAPALIAALEASGAQIAELEDGFIRSSGLGANCVPPLSAIVDFAGVYFDPSGPSDLEDILQHAEIGSALCARASTLSARLVEAAISKYAQGGNPMVRMPAGGRRILVTGQVEDDRSILSGGAGCTNLELLKRARALESDAWLIYKPHPDVEAGHRKGHVPAAEALRHADEIARDAPITSLIDSVDGLHVITSLAGFEALLRGKPVTTHGVPFYAGWGLTRDLGAVPARRSRRRSLDELVAATLLIYPRYVDPVTRLPCPAEVVIERMARGEARVTSPLVALREWQGRAQLLWQRVAGVRR